MEEENKTTTTNKKTTASTYGHIRLPMRHVPMPALALPKLARQFILLKKKKIIQEMPRTNIFKSILPLRVGSNPFPAYKGVKAGYSH